MFLELQCRSSINVFSLVFPSKLSGFDMIQLQKQHRTADKKLPSLSFPCPFCIHDGLGLQCQLWPE